MRQQCYEIQVGSDSLRLLEGSADLWNSGRVESDESVMIAYGGKALCSRMLCYWRVRVGNERGELSAWSPVQKFSIGLLDHEDFHGHYIGLAQGDVRAPLLRKSFVVENRRTAFLHVNSLGYHEVYVNGGEYVISSTVYGLKPEIRYSGVREIRGYATMSADC